VHHTMDASQERRQFRREPFHSNVQVIVESSGLHAVGNALDISPGGFRLHCSEPLPVGEVASLKFQIKTGRKVRTEETRGRVRRVQMDDDVWVIGLEFIAVLDRRKTPLLIHAATR
jgi:PilZ domain